MNRVAVALLGTAVLTCIGAGMADPAAAHPLGNFSVNHYHGLHLHPDRIDDYAVVDEAEIPTLQDLPTVDRDGDRTVTAAERADVAAARCHELAAGLHLRVQGEAVAWTVTGSDLTYRPGAADLDASRLECRLTAAVDLRQPSTVEVQDTYRTDRIGWHEVTAVGTGVHIEGTTVRRRSISDELRAYPDDLLTSPLDERSVSLGTAPGDDSGADGLSPTARTGNAVSRFIGRMTGLLNGIVAARELTVPLGLLSVGLAVLLGAGHAALPGHGKTVMAAYIAGRRGTIRDAVTVGATVTATHTTGVLVLGILLTLVAGLAGETILGWLGVGSGLLIAGIGVGLLCSALAAQSRRRAVTAAVEQHGHGHDHDHGHGHQHHGDHHHGNHHHGNHHHRRPGRAGLVGMGIAGGLVPSPSALVVLLGAIALGRTWFGVLLVIAYGCGMAAVLIAAGLLLVKVRDRLDPMLAHRFARWTAPGVAAMPVLTAVLVLIVGFGLAIRGALPLFGVTI